MPKTESDKKTEKEVKSKGAPAPKESAYDKTLTNHEERLKKIEDDFDRLVKSHGFVF